MNKKNKGNSPMPELSNTKLAIIGLGYVGLPLAVEFGKKMTTIGFDINQARINELCSGQDSTLEVEPELLAEATQLSYTTDLDKLVDSNVYIVTVPTPIDDYKRPDLTPLEKASQTVGQVLGDLSLANFALVDQPGDDLQVCVGIEQPRDNILSLQVDHHVGRCIIRRCSVKFSLRTGH